MADTPLWLKKYYGPDFESLGPELVKEGRVWALVKLSRRPRFIRGSSSIGYVLIKKKGSHAASKYIPLHEGVPSQADMSRMLRVLSQEDDE